MNMVIFYRHFNFIINDILAKYKRVFAALYVNYKYKYIIMYESFNMCIILYIFIYLILCLTHKFKGFL